MFDKVFGWTVGNFYACTVMQTRRLYVKVVRLQPETKMGVYGSENVESIDQKIRQL